MQNRFQQQPPQPVHPEAPDGEGWLHVAVKQQSPPPPPPPPSYHYPPPKSPLRYWVPRIVLALAGYSLAMGYRDWEILQAKNREAQALQQVQQLQQAKETYCKSL